MTSIREQFLSTKFNEWLDRFSPPRRIINDLAAQQADANAMMATILRFSPREGYSEWLDGMLRRMEDAMTTRSWPAPGELVKACKASGFSKESGGLTREVIESAALDRMTDWFSKFRNQCPGHGSSARTAELIRRGVLKDVREARFLGFDLDYAQAKDVGNFRMGREEWRHHVKVMAALGGIAEDEAEQRIRAEMGQSVSAANFTPKKMDAAE